MNRRVSEKYAKEGAPTIVPAHRVIQSGELARIGVAHAHGAGHPSVELVRDGDLVKAIDVTCSCGEKTRIWCSYEQNS